jgi:hypothetical protein
MTTPTDEKPLVDPTEQDQDHLMETRAVHAPASGAGIHAVVLSGSAKGASRPVGEMLRIGKAPDTTSSCPTTPCRGTTAS